MGTIITIVVVGVVFGFVIAWVMRGRSRRGPESGGTMPDLSIATEIERLDQLRDAGEITEAEYREAKSKLLS